MLIDITQNIVNCGILSGDGFLFPLLQRQSVQRNQHLGQIGQGRNFPVRILCGAFRNQLFQQELGFTPVRGSGNTDITDIGWKNTSYIWGADEGDIIGEVLDVFCPKLFKTIPVGPHAGARKHWPFFWMICPVYVYFTILSSIFCLIFDRKNFINGIVTTAKNTKARVVGMVKSFVNTNKED